MIAWMLYWVAAGAALAVAALLAERALRGRGMGTRGVWIALLALLLLPLLSLFLPIAEAAPPADLNLEAPVPIVVDAATTTGAAASVDSGPAVAWPFLLWLTASLGVVLWTVFSWTRLIIARCRWTPARRGGTPVLISRSTGPAVAGVLRPAIVLPRWIDELSEDDRRTMLTHEEEHVRAGDTRLLLAGLLLVAAVPWNPVGWWAIHRLRQAIEIDCDGRVLRRGVDPRSYAETILRVAARAGQSRLALSLGQRTRTLERRLTLMITHTQARGLTTGTVAVGALLIPALVWALPAANPPALPTLSSDAHPPVLPAAVAARDTVPPPIRGEDEMGPRFVPHEVTPELRNRDEFGAALSRAYPSSLQDAGIGGRVVVWIFVDDEGQVLESRVAESSGHERLDTAAVEVAREARFSPAMRQDEPVAVWVQFPIIFQAADG